MWGTRFAARPTRMPNHEMECGAIDYLMTIMHSANLEMHVYQQQVINEAPQND
jgi:hypothetical protein